MGDLLNRSSGWKWIRQGKLDHPTEIDMSCETEMPHLCGCKHPVLITDLFFLISGQNIERKWQRNCHSCPLRKDWFQGEYANAKMFQQIELQPRTYFFKDSLMCNMSCGSNTCYLPVKDYCNNDLG